MFGQGRWTVRLRWMLLPMVVMAIGPGGSGTPRIDHLSYSDFVDAVVQGRVARVVICDQTATGTLRDGGECMTTLPAHDRTTLALLRQHGVDISVLRPDGSSWAWVMAVGMAGVLLFLFAVSLLGQRLEGGGASGPVDDATGFGRSRARLCLPGGAGVTFDDVAGLEEAKEELREVTGVLQHPERFTALGARTPKGILLMGPPGSGKTLLARAVAGEAGLTFLHLSGSDFVELYAGVGAARVRHLFRKARRHAPCLVFIDELDAVGRRRRDGPGGVSGEREQTLNQLLVEMDGFDPGAGVVVMAATNRPDVLDPALLRPGRFDRRIVLDLPDRAGRRAIFAVHLRDKPVAADVDLDVLARQTVGFSGADIASVANEAALLAARRGRMDLSMTEIEEAIDRQLAGPPRRTRRPGEHARSVTAYHVAGHALAAVLLPHAAPPRRVSMLPRSDGEEHAWYAPDEERCTATRSELLDQVAVLLAGRAAETLVFGEATTGGAGDLETATETARRMVVEYGMSARLGPLALRSRRHPFPLGGDAVEGRGYSEAVAAEVDREIRCIVQERIAAVTTLLQRHRRDLERVAQSLLECETLTGADLLVLLAGECDAEAREGVLPVASAHA